MTCPPIDCPACADLPEDSCNDVAPACEATYCTNCDGNPYFASCRDQGVFGVCPDLLCPGKPCEDLGETSCAAAEGCHRVFTEQPKTCDCDSPGCCQAFDRCVTGPAKCDDSELGCRAREPYCEGPYVVSYEGFCYEGCVLATDCPLGP